MPHSLPLAPLDTAGRSGNVFWYLCPRPSLSEAIILPSFVTLRKHRVYSRIASARAVREQDRCGPPQEPGQSFSILRVPFGLFGAIKHVEGKCARWRAAAPAATPDHRRKFTHRAPADEQRGLAVALVEGA